MSYEREGSQMLSISEFLEVLASFSRIERMWENLTPEAMKEYFWDTPLQARFIGYTTREPRRQWTINVVIDKASDSGSEKISEEIPKEILPPKPKDVQEIVDQEPKSPSTPGTLSIVEGLANILTSPEFESHEEKGPYSKIKLNHPLEVIVGNMNELTLRKHIFDKCVANFVSYSFYLL